MRKINKRKIPRPFKMPWGAGEIIEEAAYFGQWHEPAIQLMKYNAGGYSIRFAHYNHSAFQRSPLMLDTRELKRLKASLKKTPKLHKLLKSIL